MRSRANWEQLFLPPDLSRFTCKTMMKRRGWDSNPRDGLTPSTRFPIALLRPTRTPLRGRRTGVYQKANLLLLPFSRSRSGSRRPSSPVYRPLLEGVFVTHGRQLPDDPRRGVSVEVRAVRHHLGRLICQEVRDHAHVLEPDRTG